MELSDLFFRLTNRFRITYSLKILSKSNHSSKHNSFQSRTRVSHFSSHFTNHYTIPNFIKNHRSILFNHLLLLPSPSTQIYFRHSSNDPTIEIPLALPFSSKKKKEKRKITPSTLYILIPPLDANFQSQTISNFLLKSIRKPINCFLEAKKGKGGEKTTSNHPKPLQTELPDLLACTFVINKYRDDGMRAWASACEPKHSILPEESKRSTVRNHRLDGGRGRERLAMSRVTHRHVRVEKLANWLSGNGQQVASSRSHNRVTTTTITTTTTLSLSIRIDSISFPCLGCLLDGLCVCVCARVPRFRLRPHQDTTRTGRVYGPAHCIWSQKCHTDAPHALPPRSRTPPAIEISGGRVEKERGWRRSLSLFRVCASDDNLPRLFETRTR